jgi:hypothetical protein
MSYFYQFSNAFFENLKLKYRNEEIFEIMIILRNNMKREYFYSEKKIK